MMAPFKKNSSYTHITLLCLQASLFFGHAWGMQQEYYPYHYEGSPQSSAYCDELTSVLKLGILSAVMVFIVMRCCSALKNHKHTNDNNSGAKISFDAWKKKCDHLPKYREYFGNTLLKRSFPTALTGSMLQKEISECCHTMSNQLRKQVWLNNELPAQEFFDMDQDVFSRYSFKSYVQKLELPEHAKIAFHGDFHGDIHSMNNCIALWTKQGYMDRRNPFKIIDPDFYIIFLGDYTDRGYYGAEVLYTIARLKNENQDKVFMVRGNHEDNAMNNGGLGCLQHELHGKFDQDISLYRNICRWYDFLPLALFVGCKDGGNKNFVQCCHGGIEVGYDPKELLSSCQSTACHKVTSLSLKQAYEKLNTKLQKFDLEFDLPHEDVFPLNVINGFMWGDFIVNPDELFKDSSRSTGLINFGKIPTGIMLDEWSSNECKLRALLRAHQHGDESMWDRLLNKDELGHDEDVGVAKLWINDLPIHKQQSGMLSGVNVVTFCVSPETGYGSKVDCVGLLALSKRYEHWRLHVYSM